MTEATLGLLLFIFHENHVSIALSSPETYSSAIEKKKNNMARTRTRAQTAGSSSDVEIIEPVRILGREREGQRLTFLSLKRVEREQVRKNQS